MRLSISVIFPRIRILRLPKPSEGYTPACGVIIKFRYGRKGIFSQEVLRWRNWRTSNFSWTENLFGCQYFLPVICSVRSCRIKPTKDKNHSTGSSRYRFFNELSPTHGTSNDFQLIIALWWELCGQVFFELVKIILRSFIEKRGSWRRRFVWGIFERE